MRELVPTTLAANIVVGPAAVLGLLIAGAVGCVFLAWKLRTPTPPGVYCAKCGYSLEGITNPASSCPECHATGRRIEPSFASTSLRLAKLVWWWTCAAILAGTPVAAVAVGAFGKDTYTDFHTELWPKAKHYEAATIDWRIAGRADTSVPVNLLPKADDVTIAIKHRGVTASLTLDARKPIADQVRSVAGHAGVDVVAAGDGTLDELIAAVEAAAQGQHFLLVTKSHTQPAMSSASSSASKPWVIVIVIGTVIVGWAIGLWALLGFKGWNRPPTAPAAGNAPREGGVGTEAAP